MNLRETNKQARRERILNAAVRLLKRGGAEALTMRELARAARLSEMTPYNLFGSKAGVLAALFENAMATIVTQSFAKTPVDPMERLFAGQEALADTWTEESGLYREVMRAARESGADLARYSKVPMSLLEAGLMDVAKSGLITDDVPIAEVARSIFVANQGACEPWVSGEIDDATLRRDLTIGLAIALLAVATTPTRKRILARMSAERRRSTPTAHRRRKRTTAARD